ncbi:MAG: acetyl-CoA carboxylase carboxyl transferase subunit beta, partial [Pseudomonadota bacterium]|nr:acetyl-CoA carboxylase carboxyl transferase subunit beta [Pseudomonadota bacterium]
MNWLTNAVLPKIKALVQTREVPDNLWHKCPACEQMIFHRELDQNLNVCPHCQHHMPIEATRRLALLFDDGAYETATLKAPPVDPLKFRDRKRYTERLKEAQTKTKRTDAIIVAEGDMGGQPAVVAVFDFGFMGGSMGTAVGDALLHAADLAAA